MKILLSISLLLLLAITQIAAACLCDEHSVEDELKNSSSVFTGRVLSIGENYGPEFKLVEFAALRVFKGPRINRIEVKTPSEKKECGYPFEKNEEYLVYATGDKVLSVSLCSRTAALSKAQKDVQKLTALTKSTWVGSSYGARDPFVSSAGDSSRTRRSVPTPGTLTVSSAVIVGIISSGSEFTALIRASDGKSFSMKVGDRVADGEIIRIDQESVTFLQNGKKIRKTIRPFPD